VDLARIVPDTLQKMDTLEFIYGTAWKENDTERLVGLALDAGFRGIDTANQRKHYHEAAVGLALRSAFSKGVRREELFVQSKFTFVAGQDSRLPYDPRAPIATQVAESFASSLEHLGLTFLDSYVLHGPWRRGSWSPEDVAAWTAMESLHQAGKVGQLGVSNVSIEHLKGLWARAKVRPGWVQNRCYARARWDAEVRQFCSDHGARYQGFSLLTANPAVLASRSVQATSKRHGKTPPQVVFRLARQVGMVPLTGTTDPRHMREDLATSDFTLSPAEMADLNRAW
jgi:diketogulonate reductase-like aldo/keto reductase